MVNKKDNLFKNQANQIIKIIKILEKYPEVPKWKLVKAYADKHEMDQKEVETLFITADIRLRGVN